MKTANFEWLVRVSGYLVRLFFGNVGDFYKELRAGYLTAEIRPPRRPAVTLARFHVYTVGLKKTPDTRFRQCSLAIILEEVVPLLEMPPTVLLKPESVLLNQAAIKWMIK